MLSADNLCKQFGPRSGPTKLGPNWIQTVRNSDGIPERIFHKVDFEKNQQTAKMHEKSPSRQS